MKLGMVVAGVLMCAAAGAKAQEVEMPNLLPIELEQSPAKNWSPLCWKTCWEPPDRLDWALLLVTESVIFIDLLMTQDFLARPNEYPGGEQNPLLGQHPSAGKAFAFGLAGMAATAALWYVLPPFWRTTATGTIGIFEVYNDAGMWGGGIRMRFP